MRLLFLVLFVLVGLIQYPVSYTHLKHIGKPDGRLLAQFFGQLERQWMAHLERWRVVQLVGGARDGLDDFGAAMAGVDAPQARDAVQHATAVRANVVHALGRAEQHRVCLLYTSRCV